MMQGDDEYSVVYRRFWGRLSIFALYKKTKSDYMNSKQQALYALMESNSYSIGAIQTTLSLLSHSNLLLDEMIVYIEDHRPTESQVIEKIADLIK